MDPQSVAFIPHNEPWRVSNESLRLQQVQAEHSDRLLRLERRQDDDARMKSVWGGASPFPSVSSGTPNQAPLQHPPPDHFKNFDDDTSNMIGSLHSDPEDEPRRMGATSRANSVRFDESANQGHWAHSSRTSVDLIPRSGSGLGGLPMTERSSSHKSDGRASSVHSVRSAASGRASSLNLDTGYGSGDSGRSSVPDTPNIAPGLLILGTVPAIIRCWMNTNFKHDSLLYAAVCTASYKSLLDFRLVQKLGFEDRVVTGDAGARTVELPVYFPEAVPHPASSRSSSPAPQLPTLTVTFTVIDQGDSGNPQGIQIFLGSDTLRAHSADILFSSNSMSIFDDDRSKLSIPLVRPEAEATFNHILTTNSAASPRGQVVEKAEDAPARDPPLSNGSGQRMPVSVEPASSAAPSPTSGSGKYRPPGVIAAENEPGGGGASDTEASSSSRPVSRAGNPPRPQLVLRNSQTDVKEDPSSAQPTTSRSGSSPAIWSNWRRDSSAQNTATQSDAANTGKTKDTVPYQRKDTGIKVLKPTKSITRTFSSTSAASPSPADGKSRFFDEGKRRTTEAGFGEQKRAVTPSAESKPNGSGSAGSSGPSSAGLVPKTRNNPAGGASAFAWLNPGGPK